MLPFAAAHNLLTLHIVRETLEPCIMRVSLCNHPMTCASCRERMFGYTHTRVAVL